MEFNYLFLNLCEFWRCCNYFRTWPEKISQENWNLIDLSKVFFTLIGYGAIFLNIMIFPDIFLIITVILAIIPYSNRSFQISSIFLIPKYFSDISDFTNFNNFFAVSWTLIISPPFSEFPRKNLMDDDGYVQFISFSHHFFNFNVYLFF